MSTTTIARRWIVPCLAGLLVFAACSPKKPTAASSLKDDGGGRKPSDFPELAADVFKAMDGGIDLSADEIKGRNTWNLWCGGDEQFWDRVAREALGLFDLLKTIDSRKRDQRFKELGLINQPGYRQATKPDKYGLWIDEPVEPEPESIDPKVFGRATGVMGFRLFDNPDFQGEAVKAWDPEKYDKDPQYAASKGLIRPYRVGVSCGSCHIAFHPCKPPADVNNPKWENLASAIGNQYINEGAVFAPNVKEGGFFKEMLKNQPRGTSDTSRIATDHINNPNTINPIFELGARLSMAQEETLADESLLIPGAQKTMKVPHILKDGADSVGVPGATIRVYINIGMFSQHWLQQHHALIGLTPQKPFSIKAAQEDSVYWLATQEKVANVAKFFTRLKSFRLEDAPGGKDFITKDEAVMQRGSIVFAEQCAECHSSKRPPAGEDQKDWFRREIVKPDFRDNNFFADDKRYPVTKIETNASRALGTNARAGHIWNNFSSQTYKQLPSVGSIEVWNPYSEANEEFAVPANGPGYYRTASLISCWSSAPFLHNNALGKFTGDPSVAGRLETFNDAVQKLLWPDKRLGKESIWRTTRECQFSLNGEYLPEPLRTLLKPHLDADGFFRIGNIPEGTPVNLLANVNPEMEPKQFLELCVKVKKALLEIKVKNLDSAAAKEVLKREVAPVLWKVNTCPDFVEDRGHYFGTELADADKNALIEYLKTL
ncbi:MAG TPA: hypothetical protein VFD27_18175 [Chthoniobacteraceae bacterium]|nr:hypothetical protein [Chthoniobacteraceae bacterium]